MKRWILWGVLALLIFAGGAWIANRMIRAASAEPVAMAKGLPDSAETAPSTQMQEQLMDPHLDEAARESLMEKIEMAKNIEQQQAADAIPPAPKVAPEFGPEALVMAQPQVESGIFPGPEAMIWPRQMRISNYWQGLVDGQVVMVFAGSSEDDPRQGLVVVATTSPDPAVGDIRFERLPAPDQTGSLRVVSESGGILTLETPEGGQWTFNIAAKSFGP